MPANYSGHFGNLELGAVLDYVMSLRRIIGFVSLFAPLVLLPFISKLSKSTV